MNISKFGRRGIMSGALVAAASLVLGQPAIVPVVGVAVAGFVVVRHRTNIVRLCKGTEHKFIKKPEIPTVPTTKECPACLEQVPLKASRCKHCTSQI